MMKKNVTPTQATIAKRLKEKREAKGLTLEEAANEIGISKVTLHRYEKLQILNIPAENIEKLAKLYGTTPKYIMGWTDDDGVTPKEELSSRFRWIARNASKMEEAQLKKLQELMKITFDILDDEEEE